MTSTSFDSSHPGCHELYRTIHGADMTASRDNNVEELPVSSEAHAVKARRMRSFAGQRKFQAPVADDFSRGMLAAGQSSGDDARPFKTTGLIKSLKAWLRQ